MTKYDEWLDTQSRNQRFLHYDVKVVMVPFEHGRMLSNTRAKQRAAIAADRHLTNEGKTAADNKSKETARAAFSEWNEERLRNIDADLLEQKAGLRGNVAPPDQKRVDLMVAHLLRHQIEDIAIFYGSATDSERMEMEAASAQVGRVPVSTANGKVWKPLLDPVMVNDAILERATKTNPEAAQKVRELTEIRTMQQTAVNVALSDI